MAEVVSTFLRTELRDKRADCSVEGRNGSRGRFAHDCLEFAVTHLDWIEIGRVLWQVTQGRPRLLDRRSNPGAQVDWTVIHRDDVVAPKRGKETLLDIGEEHLSGHGTFDHHRGDHFI